jgi:hypothetical protein
LGRESFFSSRSTEKQPKTKRFAKNKVVAVSVAVGRLLGVGAGPFGWRRLAEEGPTLFF